MRPAVRRRKARSGTGANLVRLSLSHFFFKVNVAQSYGELRARNPVRGVAAHRAGKCGCRAALPIAGSRLEPRNVCGTRHLGNPAPPLPLPLPLQHPRSVSPHGSAVIYCVTTTVPILFGWGIESHVQRMGKERPFSTQMSAWLCQAVGVSMS